MALDTTNFDATAEALGLNEPEQGTASLSNYWAYLDGDDLGSAIVDRFTRWRQWQSTNGLLRGWRLKMHYWMNEYRANPDVPHLAILQQWGAQNEFVHVSLNALRSLLKTILASVVQNPPAYQTRAVNADADALEAASLYQGVLDYYSRELRLTSKINKAVELAMVVDQAFIMVEWDVFATDGQAPPNQGIWKGSPSMKVLTPWDVCYDVMKPAWIDLDWIIVRDWISREKLKAQFPELADEIDACRSRAEVVHSYSEYECNTRYEMSNFYDLSDDIQVFKFFHNDVPWMPQGRFCMCLESGKMLFESPAGLIYEKLPVERFVPDEQPDMLLGYSPINELLGPQEAVNTILSAITSNANNYANQYVAVMAGTDLSPRTLGDGQKIIEYPQGTNPPQGINLTAIPPTLFEHLKDLLQYMQQVPSVSNPSRGQAPGANSTGSAMLFLASQSTANQGNMSTNYADFSAAVMTTLLHVLRIFGRTQRTIDIMGKTVASRTIVLADALKDFDEVVVDLTNPILQTPQGRMAMAQQVMQFGGATPQQAMEVATSGNLGPAIDPEREQQYELQSENEWLLNGENILVNQLDNHEAHIQMHSRLFATPWLRKPDLAQRLGINNAPDIMRVIQGHVMQHMQMLGNNSVGQTQNQASAQPGQMPPPNHPALGHQPPPGGGGKGGGAPSPSPDAAPGAPAQGQALAANTTMPNQPEPPSMPHPK